MVVTNKGNRGLRYPHNYTMFSSKVNKNLPTCTLLHNVFFKESNRAYRARVERGSAR